MNKYYVGALALGATPRDYYVGATDAEAAILATALNKRQGVKEPESGISVGGVALLVGAIIVGLVTWPRVSRWLG